MGQWGIEMYQFQCYGAGWMNGEVYNSTASTHFKQTLIALTMSQEELISRQNAQIVATKLGEALAPRPLTTATSSLKPKSKSSPSNKSRSASQDGPAAKKPRFVYIMMNVMCSLMFGILVKFFLELWL